MQNRNAAPEKKRATAEKRIVKSETPIVLADPSNYARAMITEVLRNIGYQRIYPASNAAEVIEAACVWSPRVILMENLLPDLQGTQLVYRIRRENIVPDRSVPVIMITGDPRIETVKNARMSGIDEFAAKPVSHSVIEERMDEVLLRPRPFIEAKKYVGPCRRRKRTLDYKGALKRLSDPLNVTTASPDDQQKMRMMEQCTQNIQSLAKAINPRDRGEIRALYNTATEAHEIARQLNDEALEIATACIARYIEGVGASGELQASVITTHMDAIRHLMFQTEKNSVERMELAEGLKVVVSQKLRETA